MKIFSKYMLFTFSCVLVASCGTFIGYKLFSPEKAVEKPVTQEIQAENKESEFAYINKSDSFREVSVERITPTTKMVYEYYYLDDNKTETSEEEPPYFLLDLTKEGLAEVLIDWEIIQFSTDEVVMRKTMEGMSTQHYIVGIKDGFVAVFYKEPINGTELKEITDTRVNALSVDEQSRLQDGITVVGEDQLMKILEDYGS